jgi:hypothetical protein
MAEMREVLTQSELSLSVYVEDLAAKADNAARSLREGQIRLVRGVCRAGAVSANSPGAYAATGT